MSVFELAANVSKIKRIGLVKVVNITDQAIYALVERASTLERLHLSYCDKLTVSSIGFMLNRLTRLTHLSLTGVSAFRTPEVKQYCRKAPSVCPPGSHRQ
jgi:F-box and leucine-rich repeat protein GRR1